jgi:proteasome-associated ATPase
MDEEEYKRLIEEIIPLAYAKDDISERMKISYEMIRNDLVALSPAFLNLETKAEPMSNQSKLELKAKNAELSNRVELLEEALETASEKLREQNEMLEHLAEGALAVATVVSKDTEKDLVFVSNGNNVIRCKDAYWLNVGVGDQVVVAPDSMQIVEVAGAPPIGETARVKRVLGNWNNERNVFRVEILFHESVRTVTTGIEELEPNDIIVLDQSGTVIIDRIGKEEEPFTDFDPVDWNDIGGLEDAKNELREAVEMPRQHPDIFARYGKRPPKGVLLYGPPGCGKTMLAKAVATSVSSGVPGGFLYVKGPEILDKYVGVAEAKIRALFNEARKFRDNTGDSAVVFIDEADSILYRRGTSKSSDVDRTIVAQFLAEMDGLEDSGAIVLLATNIQDSLDPAVTRDGRIDRKIQIGRPEREAAKDIFRLNFHGIPLSESIDEMAEQAVKSLFDTNRGLYEVTLKRGEVLTFGLHDLASGAMVAGIVDRASSMALRRELNGDTLGGEGVTPDDVDKAICDVLRDESGMAHPEALFEFAVKYEDEIDKVEKVKVG